MEIFHHYPKNHNSISAQKIVPFIVENIKPSSVIDIGCGTGAWLKMYQKCGVKDIMGIDGPHVPKEQLQIPLAKFYPYDLRKNKKIKINRKFDIANCLEVAEHLPEEYAENFRPVRLKSQANILKSSKVIDIG